MINIINGANGTKGANGVEVEATTGLGGEDVAKKGVAVEAVGALEAAGAVEAVEAWDPAAAVHDSAMEVDPVTGIVLGSSMRYQLNFHVHSVNSTGGLNPNVWPALTSMYEKERRGEKRRGENRREKI